MVYPHFRDFLLPSLKGTVFEYAFNWPLPRFLGFFNWGLSPPQALCHFVISFYLNLNGVKDLVFPFRRSSLYVYSLQIHVKRSAWGGHYVIIFLIMCVEKDIIWGHYMKEL
jgi:hypothetical protein